MRVLCAVGEEQAEGATVLKGTTWIVYPLVRVNGVVGASDSRRAGVVEAWGVAMAVVVEAVGRKATVTGTSGDQAGKGTALLLVRTCKFGRDVDDG